MAATISRQSLLQEIDTYERVIPQSFKDRTIKTIVTVAISVLMAYVTYVYISPIWIAPWGNMAVHLVNSLLPTYTIYKLFNYVHFLGEIKGKRAYAWLVKDYLNRP